MFHFQSVVKAALVAVLMALISLWNGHRQEAYAGSWSIAQCGGVDIDGDSPGIGAALAARAFKCHWPQAAPPSCWPGSCYSFPNNFSCQYLSYGTMTCSEHSTHGCYLGEIPTSDGRCIKPSQLVCWQCMIKAGNPIEVGTGRKIETVVDWSSGGAIPIRLVRFYSSYNSFAGAPAYSRLGRNWRTNFDSRAAYVLNSGVTNPINAVDGNLIHFAMPDSTEFSFQRVSGLWKPVVPRPHPTAAGQIYWDQIRTDVDAAVTVAASGVELRVPDGTRYSYDPQGLLVRITAPGGYSQFLDYYGTLDAKPTDSLSPSGSYQGILNTKVTDSFGRVITFIYQTDPLQQGLLAAAQLPDGTTVSFGYVDRMVLPAALQGQDMPVFTSAVWGLGSVTYPDDTPMVATDNPKVTYEYKQDEVYPFALTGWFDENNNRRATFTYDSQGRATSSQHDSGADLTTLAYDDVNNKVTVTNPSGRQTVYSFTRVFGAIQQLTAVDGIATPGCAASNTVYAYDANGFRSQATDAEGRVTKWTRNARGLPTSTTEGFGTPEARTTTTSWDAARPLPTQIVKPGLTTDLSYDGDGNVTSMTATDTTTTTVPYSTNGQTRTTTYTYTAIAPPAPPAPAPTGTPLPDVPLPVINGDAETGDMTGWTNDASNDSRFYVVTGNPCVSKCFNGGGTNAGQPPTNAYQDIAIPAGNIAEVDQGNRAVRLTWKQGHFSTRDTASMRVKFLDATGVIIGQVNTNYQNFVPWTSRQMVGHIPANTRSIRVQMVVPRRHYYFETTSHFDDIALTLTADGTGAAEPTLSVVNPNAAGPSTTGWTVASGTIQAASGLPGAGDNTAFRDGSLGADVFQQDIDLPADRFAGIDAGVHGVNLNWLEYSAGGLTADASIQFLDAAGQPVGAASVSPHVSALSAWVDRSYYADVPPLTRKVRIAFGGYHVAYGGDKDIFWTGIAARLVGRHGTGGSVNLLTAVDGPLSGAGDTTSYGYDTAGNLHTVTDALGHVTTVTAVNGAGLPTAITDENGVVTTLAYDARNRLTTVTVNPGASQAVTTTGYDAVGQVTKVTAPDGSFLQYTWNAARRLTTVTNNTGETITYGYNANGDVTSTIVKSAGGSIVQQQSQVFDELGRLLKSIGAANQTTQYAYDRTDNLKTVTDPRSGLFSYAYDALQRVIRTTDQVSAQVNLTRDGQDNVTAYQDARAVTTSYVRNGFGEVIREQGPDLGTTTILRDARGLATQVTDPRGVVANMTYDNAGRLATVSYPSAAALNVTYSYDDVTGGNFGLGRLTRITDGSGSTSWVYDAFGRVTRETRVIGSFSFATSYSYDAAGRVATMTYPSGRVVTYTRNALGQVTQVANQKNAAAAYDMIASGVSWQPMGGAITGLTHGNGLVSAWSYDLDGRRAGYSLKNGATNVASLSYAYGDGLNLTAITDAVTAANSQTLSYTLANRLATAQGPWGTLAWTYDGVGNRLTEALTSGAKTTTTASVLTAGTNQLASLKQGSKTTRSFTYDAAGNILNDVRGTVTYATTYNARNRAASVTKSGAAYATYGYNGLEQLVTRTTTAAGGPTGAVYYYYDLAGNLLGEANSSGVIQREYIWLPEADNLPLALITSVTAATPVISMVHADHLNRPIRMTSAAKATVWSASWKPFGEPQALSATIENNLRFPGQYFLIETALAYNWHRTYDPTTGRYTQADPLRFVDGPSVYGYVGGSPGMRVDKSGLMPAPGGEVGRLAKCKSVKRKIENLSKEIQRQYDNLDANPQNLPMYIGPGEDQYKTTIRGHRRLLDKYWRDREAAYKEYAENRCDDDGSSGGCPQCGAAGVAVAGAVCICLLVPEACAVGIIAGATVGAAAQ